MSTIYIGGYNGGSQFNTTMRKWAVYPYRMSNTAQAALTTITYDQLCADDMTLMQTDNLITLDTDDGQ